MYDNTILVLTRKEMGDRHLLFLNTDLRMHVNFDVFSMEERNIFFSPWMVCLSMGILFHPTTVPLTIFVFLFDCTCQY